MVTKLKLETRLKKNKGLIALVAVVIVALAFSSQFPSLPSANMIVTPGWEIYNQIQAMKFDGVGLKSSASEFTSPNDVFGPMWRVDCDDPAAQIPTVEVQTSDIRHVDFAGNVIPLSQSAVTRPPVTRGGHTYTFDYHVYMFDVSIRTIADRQVIGKIGMSGYSIYSHETMYADNGQREWPFGPETVAGKAGKPFGGGVYVKFAINPWRGPAYDPATYVNATIEDAWSGIMNAYVVKKDMGQVANQWSQTSSVTQSNSDDGKTVLLHPSNGADARVVGGLDEGAQIPMFADDGSYGTQSQKTNWDTDVTPDTRIPSTNILYLPVQEEAGAYITRDFWGGVTQVTPIDVYIKYTVRVDVLTTHDFVLQTGEAVPTLAPPKDYYTYTESWWDQFWRNLGVLFSGNNVLLLIIILAIVLAVIWLLKGKGGKKEGGGDGKKTTMFGLTLFDWLIVGGLAVFCFIPDPLDLLTLGVPVVEGGGAAGYLLWRKGFFGKKKEVA